MVGPDLVPTETDLITSSRIHRERGCENTGREGRGCYIIVLSSVPLGKLSTLVQRIDKFWWTIGG